MVALESLGPQIRWMQAQPGDPAGLAFTLLALLALVAFLVVRWILRKPTQFRSDLTKQLLEMPVRRFRKKRRRR
jgi:type II secretory pathway component PulF